MRYINIADTESRDAVVRFGSKIKKLNLEYKTPKKGTVTNYRLVKKTPQTELEQLLEHTQGNPENVGQLLLDKDVDLDPQLTGRFIQSTQDLFIRPNGTPSFQLSIVQKRFNKDHELVEEKEYEPKQANVNESTPILISDKTIDIEEAVRKFAFSRTYQLFHTNGLTYDYMFAIAKDLHSSRKMALVGAGKKLEPIVFQDGGKPYRGFLEGRIEKNSYMLLLHLSDMELKRI